MAKKINTSSISKRDLNYLSEKIELGSIDTLFMTILLFIFTLAISFKELFLNFPYTIVFLSVLAFAVTTEIISIFNKNFHRKGEAIAMIFFGVGMSFLFYIQNLVIEPFWHKIIIWILVLVLTVGVSGTVGQLIEYWFKTNTPLHYYAWKNKKKKSFLLR
jgi:hypothetical protein